MATAHPKPNLISSEHLEGATVYDASGKDIGRIDRLMIDKASGQVRYAIIDFCGFMCLRHGNHPVPWSAMTYDRDGDRYTANITEQLLEAAPELKEDNWMDREWETLVHQHYKAAPYWNEPGAAGQSESARAET